MLYAGFGRAMSGQGSAAFHPSRLRGCALAGALSLALASTAVFSQAADPAGLIEVRTGDTFSGIAAKFTGDARNWRKMYSAELSGLSNPNLIAVGMRLEVATDSAGARYLRVVGARPAVAAAPMAKAAASAPVAAPAPRPVAAAPVPAPVPAPAPAPVAAVVAPAPAPAAPAPLTVPPVAAADGALVIGVLPNLSAALLAPQYEFLRRYLERLGGQKVRIVIPANFKVFFDNTVNGDYDLAVSAPHFARVAQLDRGLLPLVAFEPRINALMVVPSDSTATGPKDLRERAVAFANPQSLVAMYGMQWLRANNLEGGKDFEIKAARTDLGVGRMLLSGDAAAAIMSNGEFRALPPDESSRLKIAEVFARIPNFIIVAHPRLERDKVNRLRTLLKGFLADSEDGSAFARATGFSSIVDADDAQLRELDPYVAQTRRAMGFTK